jgi:hypothetical protein
MRKERVTRDMTRVSNHDLSLARRFPDDFLELPGSPLDRIKDLINRHWGRFDPVARAELAQALLPVLLDMLNTSGEASELHRGLCEGVVAVWMRRLQHLNSKAG